MPIPTPQDILNAIQNLPSLDSIKNSLPKPPSLEDIKNAFPKTPSLEDMKKFFDNLSLPPPPPVLPPPIDPNLVVNSIAQALSNAETTLNKQGLLIVNCTVRAEMDVKVGDMVGGHAEINFQITPKPQS